MKRLIISLSIMVGVVLSPYAVALDIFACEPEWGALAQELGGERVAIYTATNAFQDPHQIQAKPLLCQIVKRNWYPVYHKNYLSNSLPNLSH